MRILVTEKLAPSGLEAMAAAGHDVDVQLDLSPEQLLEAIEGAPRARRAIRYQGDLRRLEAGRDLIVVGRGWSRHRQRRCPGSYTAWRDGGQRTGVEHRLGR